MKFPRVIYALRHEATGKLYIGSTSNLTSRVGKHISDLKRGKHSVPEFQADFDRYENKEITVSILDTAQVWGDRVREYVWMRTCRTYDRQYGYNYMDPHFNGARISARWEEVRRANKTGGAS